MSARFRKPDRTGSSTAGFNFVGDEEFSIESVHMKTHVDRSVYEISLNMVPRDANLLTTIAGVTLPMSQAMETFYGLESWINEIAEHPQIVSDKGVITPLPHVPHQRRPGSLEEGSW